LMRLLRNKEYFERFQQKEAKLILPLFVFKINHSVI
jgi:hypothetical protein